MFLANMRMATKLGAGFALVTLLTLALGSISLWQMRQMDASTRAVVQHAMPSVVDVSSLRELWSRLRRAEAGILNVNSVAEVDGYVIEGHVPAAALRRLLAARPLATGLAVPGMPAGSPGMDFPGVVPEPYEVFLFGPSVQKTFGRFRGAREI